MYIIRSNIFQPNSMMADFFSQYSIQVSVIHRPSDEDFSRALRKIALHLHVLTGRHVVFFPMIDPPQNWMESVRDTDFYFWWRNQMMLGGGFNDSLVKCLADYFQINWNELPALVISPSLWNGAYLTLPTNAGLIERQLRELTNLADHSDHPTIEDIEKHIQEKIGVQPGIINEDARFLSSFYEFLDNYDSRTNRFNENYWSLIRNELSIIKDKLGNIREEHEITEQSDEENQLIIQKTANQLIAPAHVFDLTNRTDFSDDFLAQKIPGYHSFENDSKIFIRSSSILCDYIQFLNKLRTPSLHIEDFTPGLQGFWKALENEMNCSLVQVERAFIGIDIENYYTLFQPGITIAKSDVGKKLNIQVEGERKHKFLTLGESKYVFDNFIDAKNYQISFSEFLHIQFKFTATQEFIENWGKIKEIRNEGSHVSPLYNDKYDELIILVRDAQVFPPLIDLKQIIKTNLLTGQ